jgi:transcription termination factor Rho
VNGIVTNAPDCVLLVLLLRPRAEEATEWRRRFPEADVVVGASAFSETPPEQTLQLCDLMLEAAQRQTELGRDVVLLVDSLTALWGTMLEAEEADAQREADLSASRRRMQEWVRRAGCFHGQGPLGGGLGGSLTLIGTVWHQSIDTEAEEENDLHPHLRLLEYVLPEARWLVPLSETLSRQRLYPTIDVRRCRSQDEERLLPAESVEAHLTARGRLPERDPSASYLRVLSALDASDDQAGLLVALR